MPMYTTLVCYIRLLNVSNADYSTVLVPCLTRYFMELSLYDTRSANVIVSIEYSIRLVYGTCPHHVCISQK